MKQITILLTYLLAAHALLGQSIPNGDFEHWTTFNFFEPSGWMTSNIETIHENNWITVMPVDGHDGSSEHAIRLTTDGQNGRLMPGYFTNTGGDPLEGEGGVPYQAQPTFLRGFARYHTMGADTAFLVVAFKKAGEIIGLETIKFQGHQSEFIQFSQFLQLTQTPDSVVVAAVSSDVRNPGVMVTGSYLELDDLTFEGRWAMPQLPNHDFETWQHSTINHALGWKVMGRTVERTDQTPFGEHAITMTSYSDWDGHVHPSGIRTGYVDPGGEWWGGLPYAQLNDTLRGWYKYLSDGADAGCLSLEMISGDVSLGGAFYQFYPTEDWTFFEIPMNLNLQPDTLRLQITSSAYPYDEAVAGSKLFIDNLQLTSQPLFMSSLRMDAPGDPYPNPAVALIHIPMPVNYRGDIHVMVYDEKGGVVKTMNVHQPESILRLPLEGLASGNYLYDVYSDEWLFSGRFVKN